MPRTGNSKLPRTLLKGVSRELVLFFLAALFLGCAPAARETRVLCAASLVGLLDQSSKSVGEKISVQSGGSHTLLEQLKNGAQADLLLIADARLVSQLPKDRIADHKTIAGNRLELVTGPHSSGSLEELLQDPEKTLAVADPDTAPLGEYSRQALTHFTVKARLVPLKDAGAVLAALQSGHADLAMLYHSDTSRDSNLKVLQTVPDEWHDPISYEAVLLHPTQPGAQRLYDYWSTENGKALVVDQGLEAQ